MRTPAQTLERLAEVAPKEWGCSYSWDEFRANDCEGIYCPQFGDIRNGAFTAWCKKQLRKRGWFTLSQCLIDSVMSQAHKPLAPRFAFERPTEWQAVAECLIAVLEKENEAN